MNAARPSDGLLGAKHTIKLLNHLEDSSNGFPFEQLLEDFTALSHASHSKTFNTINMLEDFEVVALDYISGGQRVSSNIAIHGYFTKIQHATVQLFVSAITLHGRESCIRSNMAGTSIELDSFFLPGVADGSLLWLLEFGIVIRTKIGDRYWRVTSDFAEDFLNCAQAGNDERHSKRVTISTLKMRIEGNEELGKEAEEWILKFEKRRLSQHMLVDNIRRISDDDVSAGYDIVSFSGSTTLTFDRFIEVKSYSNKPRFFWSQNEIEKAKELSEKYVLILVDRTRLNDPEYTPQEISDPHRALFQTENCGWRFQPNSYEFNKI